MTDIIGGTFVLNPIELDYPIVECIESALSICKSVTIVDGGSIDGSPSYLKSRFGDYVNIVIYNWNFQTRNSEAEQRNVVLKNCKGKWIYLFDGDEVLHEKYKNRIIDLLKEGQFDIYCFTLYNLYRCQRDEKYKIFNKPDGVPWRPFIIRNNKGIYFGQSGNKRNGCPHSLLVDRPCGGKYKRMLNAYKKLPIFYDLGIKIFHYGQCRYEWAIARSLNFWTQIYNKLYSTRRTPQQNNLELLNELTFKLEDRSHLPGYSTNIEDHPKVMKNWISQR